MVPRAQRQRREARNRLLDLRHKICLFPADVKQNGKRNRVVSFQANMRSGELWAVIEADLESAGSNRCDRLAASAQDQHRNLDRIRVNMQRGGRPVLRTSQIPAQPDSETHPTHPKPRGPHPPPTTKSKPMNAA